MLHDRKLLKKTAKIKKMRTNNAQKDRMVASCLIQVLYRPPGKKPPSIGWGLFLFPLLWRGRGIDFFIQGVLLWCRVFWVHRRILSSVGKEEFAYV